MPQPSSVLTISNPVLTTSNAWYEFKLLPGTTVLSIQARQNVDLLVSNLADQSTYFTIKNGGAYYDEDLVFSGSLWFSCGVDGTVVEVITWSIKF